jgi:hypothetical protein
LNAVVSCHFLAFPPKRNFTRIGLLVAAVAARWRGQLCDIGFAVGHGAGAVQNAWLRALAVVTLFGFVGYTMADPSALHKLRNEHKVEPMDAYTDTGIPEEGRVLSRLVDLTIDNITPMPEVVARGGKRQS